MDVFSTCGEGQVEDDDEVVDARRAQGFEV